MVQPPDGLHLAFEAGDGVLIAQPAAGQNLDGHDAVQLGVQCLVDPAHAAAAEFFENLVFAEHLGHVAGKGDSPRPTSGRRPPERPSGCHAQMGAVPFSRQCRRDSRLELRLGQARLATGRPPQTGDQRIAGVFER